MITKNATILHELQQEWTARTRLGRHKQTLKVRNKKYTFRYYLELHGKQRVCKSFYLSTLAISQTRVNSYHKTKSPYTGTPGYSKQGKHTKHKISDDNLTPLKVHIYSASQELKLTTVVQEAAKNTWRMDWAWQECIICLWVSECVVS